MKDASQAFYEAVSAEERQQPLEESSAHMQLPARRLDRSLLETILYSLFDLSVASLALLFTAFGFCVYKYDGVAASAGSTGSKLYHIAQYAPTIFPVLFAAIVGGSMERIASWRIQTKHGATLGLVEQCLGSQTLSRAFTTQIRLRAFNFAGVAIVCLWSLSPLGSQASLRVISIVPSPSDTSTYLTVYNTSLQYRYAYANGLANAYTIVQNPVIASIEAARLLADRNQDLWGNVRFPAIEPLEHSGVSGWLDAPANTNLTYPALVGTPIDNLPMVGNTSFTFPGYYLSISCEEFRRSEQSVYTNFSTAAAPSPGNIYDCSWASGGSQYQMAISLPCQGYMPRNSGTVRNARRLIWQSPLTYAECSLTTTFVDVKMACTGSSSGSLCKAHALRRSVNPSFHSNWTVFDMDGPVATLGIIQLLTRLFPFAQLSGGTQPILKYLSQPYHAIGNNEGPPVYTIGASTFQLRLAQILNTLLFIGIDPSSFTGSFNSSSTNLAPGSLIEVTAETRTLEETVSCDTVWLGILVIASSSAFFIALFSALVRIMTVAPSVLGSTCIVLLPQKIEGVSGNSTWCSDTWTRRLWYLRLFLGDVEPQAHVGRIALTTQKDGFAPVRAERLYT